MVVQQQRPLLPALVSAATDIDVHLRSSRTVKDALAAPTIAHAVLGGLDEQQVLIKLSALIKECMIDYFDEDTALKPTQVPVFAEFILDGYLHESLGDVKVFLKGVAMAKYGEGKTYGKLTAMKLMPMWREYLEEKAVEREKQLASEKNGGVPEVASNVLALMAKAQGPAAEQWMMIARLKRTLPHMDNDALRKQWRRAHKKGNVQAREIIVEEARRRGLIKPKDDKQNQQQQP